MRGEEAPQGPWQEGLTQSPTTSPRGQNYFRAPLDIDHRWRFAGVDDDQLSTLGDVHSVVLADVIRQRCRNVLA